MSHFEQALIGGAEAGGDVAAAIEYVKTHLVTPVEGQPHLIVVGTTVLDISEKIDPRRQVGERWAHTTDSFVALTKAEAIPESVVFYNEGNARFATIVDYGTQDVPTRDEHRVEFIPQKTPEWQAWGRIHGAMYPQTIFAEHIEEWRDTVVDPDGATLLELIQDIRGHRNVEFQSARRLANGETQFQYVEKITTGSRGTVAVPSELTLRFAVFEGEPEQTYTALLRYAIDAEGGLTLGVRLRDADKIQRDAIRAIAARVDAELDLPVYAGWYH